MFNQNSPIIQNMINTGQFGTQQPMGYDPYGGAGNIIPISQTNYNQNNNLVFSPVCGGYDYGYQQPQYDYYNPYGASQFGNPYGSNDMYYNGNNPYANNNYFNQCGYYNNGYQNYYGGSPIMYQQQAKQQQKMLKLQHKIVGTFFGKEYTEEELEELVNPTVRMNKIPRKEMEMRREFNQMQYYQSLVDQPPLETNAMRTARYLNEMSNNYHEAFDNMSMRDFLADELWKLKREFWISENVKMNGKDLSGTYSSSDYNELLNMHRSSNPYVNELLDTSRYDNNLDDMEIGLPTLVKAREQRQINITVPDFISDEATKKRREAFTNEIINQIYNKHGGGGKV